MFDMETIANIWVYVEYIIPGLVLFIIMLAIIIVGVRRHYECKKYKSSRCGQCGSTESREKITIFLGNTNKRILCSSCGSYKGTCH